MRVMQRLYSLMEKMRLKLIIGLTAIEGTLKTLSHCLIYLSKVRPGRMSASCVGFHWLIKFCCNKVSCMLYWWNRKKNIEGQVLRYNSKIFLLTKPKLDLERNMSEWQKPLPNNQIKKTFKKIKINFKMPHLNSKSLARKRYLVETKN